MRRFPGLPSLTGLQLTLPCDLTQVRSAARRITDFLRKEGCRENDVAACELALVEACNNAIQNALPQNQNHPIEIEASTEADHIWLQIADHNQGFEWPEESCFPTPESTSGRGIPLINALMEHVEYSPRPGGNLLLLGKRRAN